MNKPAVLPPTNREESVTRLMRVLLDVHPGKPVRVKYEIARPDKTPAQNRYLWGVPYTMLEEVTGYTKDELHEWNCGAQWGWKDRACPKTPRNPAGLESVPVRSTTRDENDEPDNCSREEMLALWARAQRLGASFDCVIPDPDPDYWKTR